jgi:hypothetical protein
MMKENGLIKFGSRQIREKKRMRKKENKKKAGITRLDLLRNPRYINYIIVPLTYINLYNYLNGIEIREIYGNDIYKVDYLFKSINNENNLLQLSFFWSLSGHFPSLA